ncbi:MAG: phage tail tape measure protein, partial [Gallionella sp.]
TATARIKTTPIERMTSALRTMRSAASAAHETLMKVARVGAAVAAGGYLLKSVAARPMAYDRRLALMANTAYSERDVSGRIAGKAELDKAIRAATKNGHGTPEQAAETLNTLIGSGAMGKGKSGIDASMKLLPMLQEAAHGTGADANDLAQIAIAAKQNMGLSNEQISLAISKAIRAGQEGGFELSNMSRWLPQQMAMAANNGMKGMGGFESLISANQATRMTAGTADEAGNNLVNLLAKVTSNDTANDFKKQHVDLYGSLVANMGKGMNSLEAFAGIVQGIGSKDKKYLDLKAKVDAAKSDPEKQKLYESMADIMMAKGVGKTVQDRQALTGLFGMISPTGKYKDVSAAVKKEQGAEIGISSRVIDSTLDAKADRLGNAKTYAAVDALGAVEGPLGVLLDGASETAETFPKLTAALYAATVAVGVYTAAMMGGALIGGKDGGILNFLKGKLPGGFAEGGRAAPSPGESLGIRKPAAPGLLSRLAAMALMPGAEASLTALGGTALAGGALGYGAGTWLYNSKIKGTEFGDNIGGMIATLLAKLGNEEAKQALEINLHMDGEKVATVVNARNTRHASRH